MSSTTNPPPASSRTPEPNDRKTTEVEHGESPDVGRCICGWESEGSSPALKACGLAHDIGSARQRCERVLSHEMLQGLRTVDLRALRRLQHRLIPLLHITQLHQHDNLLGSTKKHGTRTVPSTNRNHCRPATGPTKSSIYRRNTAWLATETCPERVFRNPRHDANPSDRGFCGWARQDRTRTASMQRLSF